MRSRYKSVRTTVDLDETLLDRAKRLARKEGRTLGAVLNNALGAYLGSLWSTGASSSLPTQTSRGLPASGIDTRWFEGLRD
jgi:hypothetical protein